VNARARKLCCSLDCVADNSNPWIQGNPGGDVAHLPHTPPTGPSVDSLSLSLSLSGSLSLWSIAVDGRRQYTGKTMGQAVSYEEGQAALPSCLPDPCRCEGEEPAIKVLMPAKMGKELGPNSPQAGLPHRASAVHIAASRDPGAHSQKVPTARKQCSRAPPCIGFCACACVHPPHPAYSCGTLVRARGMDA